MGGGSKEYTAGYRYFFGIHMGIGRGPVDAFREVRVGDRTAWKGKIVGNTTININAPGLFGGEEKEGGVQGPLQLMFGEPDQAASSGLVSMVGSFISGYRGMFTVFFNGLVGMNNPYPKPWKFRFGRVLKGWDGEVWYPDRAKIGIDFLENPSAPNSGVVVSAPLQSDLSTTVATGFEATDPSFDAIFEGSALRLSNINPSDQETLNIDLGRVVPQEFTGSFASIEIGFDLVEFSQLATYLSPVVFRAYFIRNPIFGGSTSPGRRDVEIRYGYFEGQFQFYFADGSSSDGGIYAGTVALGQFPPGRFSVRFEPATTVVLFNGSIIHSRPGSVGQANEFRTFIGVQSDPGPITQANQATARIRNFSIDVVGISGLAAMNPAHIIYECLTNRVWGRGLARAKLDDAAFRAAADQLASETFGLCIKWTRTDEIASFVQSILDHIGATIYVSRTTGLITLKLIRGDYDIDTVPFFDSESGLIEVRDAVVGATAKTINSVSVTYHDPLSDLDQTVTVNNPAALMSAGGGVNAVNKKYPGIPYPALAVRVAQRDLRAASTNLRRFTLIVDQRGDDIEPGSVIAIEDSKRGIPKMAVRVGRVRDGSLLDGKITLEVVQDVFALPDTSFAVDVPSTYVPPDTRPCVPALQRVVEAPYFMVARRLSAAELDYVTPDGGYISVLSQRGKPLAVGVRINRRIGAATLDDNVPDGSYQCGV